ncbi:MULTISPECIES: urea ABC transporter ATP-binding protein UrtD [Caballeronia]|jgi:urea transport system ATP-binding protein|uniref:Urea ABC transporter ATP-binding protein n=1 Tax=Caballeronia zhejiangensis TaxID=871203 RepID=A0A656QEC2_9BURK|nr:MULTISPECIES: urea ABC transporter ATP-binding protein UrtD [Caballeronia]EKS73188.1 urea ABC transporter ATP-binding protein UrtD [Burkholderia sp. SJ98]KDR28685.1 urea ABC transporter ATP-binding protein [Caballeronia zhejiangensis]MCG7402923.1 urea ABC transporter ATP-binding protein UrtD [Caballeronia zhejiangensis]MDR5765918.1 urea ABC transporter ATP-binding protein UrtD [Caballeronia sp. LZ028]MDR5786694.1 urea ABC transporter ATP-binding protein UrtD [Caballeronia sp. LP003]
MTAHNALIVDLPPIPETSHKNINVSSGLGHVLAPGEIDVSHGTILYLEDVTVSFDGFRALNKLTLSIDVGELRCVIGPNGAGKTTMMDVITGKTRPDDGKVFLGQTFDLTRMSEPVIARTGIGRKFQKPTVFENHPVWENLELAMKTDKRWFASLRARLDGAAQARIEETLELIRLQHQATRLAGELSHGQKQRLEIGMLLMQQPALLLLDEPAAGMTDHETMELAELLNKLRGSCSMMVVEHDMEFVAALSGDSGKVTVMAEGSVLAEGTLDDVKRDEAVIESYLGR